MQQSIHQAVAEGVQPYVQALQSLQPQYEAEEFYDEPSEEELAQAAQEGREYFAEVGAEHGVQIDGDAAFQQVTAVYEDLLDAGMDEGEASEAAYSLVAEQAIAVEQGAPIFERLIGAELARTRAEPSKRWEVEQLAAETLQAAAERGLIPQGGEREFAVQVLRSAADAHAPADSKNRYRTPDEVVRYYSQLNAAGDMMAKLDRPPEPVAEPTPGRAMSVEETVRRWAPRIQAEARGRV